MNPTTNQYDLLDPTGVMNGTRGVKTYYPYAALANTSMNTKGIHTDTTALVDKAETISQQLGGITSELVEMNEHLSTIASTLSSVSSALSTISGQLDTVISNQTEGV